LNFLQTFELNKTSPFFVEKLRNSRISLNYALITFAQYCMSIMIVQTICKLTNAELFLKLLYIQSKEIRNKKYHREKKENLKNGKVRLRRISTLERRRHNNSNILFITLFSLINTEIYKILLRIRVLATRNNH